MAWYYVKSGGTATGDGGRYTTEKNANSWATEFSATSEYYKSLEDAMGATTAPGDRDFLMVSDASNFSFAGAYGQTFLNTTAAKIFVWVLSVDDSADVTAYAAGGAEGVTGTTNDIGYNGEYFMSGLTLKSEDNVNLGIGQESYQQDLFISLEGTNTDAPYTLIYGWSKEITVKWTTATTNTELFFGGLVYKFGVTIDNTSTNVTNALLDLDGGTLYSFDCSGQATTVDIVGSSRLVGYKGQVVGLLHPTSWTGDLSTAALDYSDQETTNVLQNYGSGSDDWSYFYERIWGTIETTNSVYYDNSPFMADGTTRISYKVDTTASVSDSAPAYWEMPNIDWDPSYESESTLTVKVAYTGTGLTDADIGLLVVYPDVTNPNLMKFATSYPVISGTQACFDVLATTTTLTDTGVETTEWTGLTTGDDTYDLSITLTASSVHSRANVSPVIYFVCRKNFGAESLYISTSMKTS